MSSALLPGEECRSEWCEVRGSLIHGRGVFATRDIPAETRIIEYLGEKIDKEESDLRGWAQMDRHNETGEAAVYIFTLDDDWDIDGNVPENAARLINHGCDVNCEAYIDEGVFGYGLKLMSASSQSELPELGLSSVVVALVENELYIRIFSSEGTPIVDSPESDLEKGQHFDQLKELLAGLSSAELAESAPESQAEIIKLVASLTGQSRSIGIWSIRDIPKDEELLFNYGFDLENWEDHPCRCGADCCPGYIAGSDYWEELKQKIETKKRLEMAATSKVVT